jgi:hypothetical protein
MIGCVCDGCALVCAAGGAAGAAAVTAFEPTQRADKAGRNHNTQVSDPAYASSAAR